LSLNWSADDGRDILVVLFIAIAARCFGRHRHF